MFTSTPKRPSLTPLQDFSRITKPTLLPPFSSLFNHDAEVIPSKLPSAHEILSSQTSQLHVSASAPSLATFAVGAGNFSTSSTGSYTRNSLDTSMALRPSLSFPIEQTGSIINVSRKSLVQKSTTSSSSDTDVPFTETATKIASRLKTNHSPAKDFAFISHSPATFPSQEPNIDNASLARRKRRRTSPNELAILNQEFLKGSTPGKSKRLEISKKVNMTEKAVQIWFQNKRQSIRRLRSCEKEITELPPTPDTSINSSFCSDSSIDTTQIVTQLQIPATPGSPNSHLSFKAHLSPVRPSSTPKATTKTETYDKRPSFRLPLTKTPQYHCDKTGMQKFDLQEFKYATRRPLGALNTNILESPKAHNSKDVQCIEGLLSLKTAAH